MKKYVVRITLLLLIFVTVFVGCQAISNLEIRRELGFETPIEKYTGPQTVEGLMEAFDARYSSQATKWATASETSSGKKRHLEFTLEHIDAEYPREEWLQMLLNKGGTIENFEAYSGYLNVRSDMILKEFHTENDWEIVKASYIDTLIQEFQHEHQLITEANRVHPETEEWVVIGENALPQIPGRIYVQKTESTANIWHTTRTTTKSKNGEHISTKGPELSEKQKLDLLNTGVQPAGWEVVYVDEDGNPIR
ncbi:MAG: hypothetical protein OXH39_00090 [Candidatus Poribacteria bacterium]|nr:hypothetical protein [Candidatus Poribacteria bacterium]